MAEKKKKTQAEKAAESGKKSGRGRNANSTDKKVNDENKIPVRVITSIAFLSLFVITLILAFQSEGTIPGFLYGLFNGLLGKIGYLFSIPAFLYLFVIHAFSGKRPVSMRTVCVALFVLCCGCIAHLSAGYEATGNFWEVLSGLYLGGVTGQTGGVICGAIAMLLHMLLNNVFSYILLFIGALLTLLGAMQITIPSIIRAIRNRPRPEKEPEQEEERQEPATVVVNYIANQHIAHQEKRKQKKEAEAQQQESSAASVAEDTPESIFSQIDSEVDAPVSAAGGKQPESSAKKAKTKVSTEVEPDMIPVEPIQPIIPEEQTDPVAPSMMPELVPVDTKKQKVTAEDAEESAAQVAAEIALAETEEKPEYTFPPISLLKLPKQSASDGMQEMRENARRLTEALESFKIEAKIINVTRGPNVTRYDVELKKGVRKGKLTSAADDLALCLGAPSVRIAAVPNKISVVGIEVPNNVVTTVSLREVIDSDVFEGSDSKTTFAVGKDIGGNCIVGNISKLPHMLIAGTTGSGKSVCMNSIIISLLYKASPDDVKLIMVDPKMVELGGYNGIPHLLIPVVTDPKKAAGSLQWAVSEMMRRYKAMSEVNVREIDSYNALVERQDCEGKKLPQIVVIIDELADLMLVAAKEVEDAICRIAAMGRASGIHLLIATQRPSADVITGLMKANIPSRIAFAVASAMESRIILDNTGAETLLGKGDMLFSPIGQGKPRRVQGCFVSDAEVEAVASYVKSNFTSNYDQEIMDDIERKAKQAGQKGATAVSEPDPNDDESMGDEMLPAAVEVFLETGQASVSMLQRRLKLGYARAARIVDEMEERKIVGPYQGSKPRTLLITKEQWDQMNSEPVGQMAFEDLDDTETSEEDVT